jgi:hypothetical protein
MDLRRSNRGPSPRRAVDHLRGTPWTSSASRSHRRGTSGRRLAADRVEVAASPPPAASSRSCRGRRRRGPRGGEEVAAAATCLRLRGRSSPPPRREGSVELPSGTIWPRREVKARRRPGSARALERGKGEGGRMRGHRHHQPGRETASGCERAEECEPLE